MTVSILDSTRNVIDYLARGIEFAAAIIIAIAALRATIQSLHLLFSTDSPPEAKVAVRLTLGRWLAVALEFELAADVLNTAVTPTWGDIEKLAAIAALRTALNYFLEKEIREESRVSQEKAEAHLQQASQAANPGSAPATTATATVRVPHLLRTDRASRSAVPST